MRFMVMDVDWGQFGTGMGVLIAALAAGIVTVLKAVDNLKKRVDVNTDVSTAGAISAKVAADHVDTGNGHSLAELVEQTRAEATVARDAAEEISGKLDELKTLVLAHQTNMAIHSGKKKA